MIIARRFYTLCVCLFTVGPERCVQTQRNFACLRGLSMLGTVHSEEAGRVTQFWSFCFNVDVRVVERTTMMHGYR